MGISKTHGLRVYFKIKGSASGTLPFSLGQRALSLLLYFKFCAVSHLLTYKCLCFHVNRSTKIFALRIIIFQSFNCESFRSLKYLHLVICFHDTTLFLDWSSLVSPLHLCSSILRDMHAQMSPPLMQCRDHIDPVSKMHNSIRSISLTSLWARHLSQGKFN